jgi:ribosomal protein S18 acetylase RimI-like enzyme
MTDPTGPRGEYQRSLVQVPASTGFGRAPTPEDAEALAQLMLDAYRGTIDYFDETIDDARDEVASYLENGARLDWSRVHEDEGGILDSAVLAASIGGEALVCFAMTAAAVKGWRLAARLLDEVLNALQSAGLSEVSAVITVGNDPSERLFTRAGFERVD